MPNPLLSPSDNPANTQAFVLQGADTAAEPTKAAASWQADDRNAAANLIRQRVADAYSEEPTIALQPAAQQQSKQPAVITPGPTSKHQQFLRDLQSQAKSVAEIQTQWHQYYTQLPEAEKHEVWREFYQDQAQHSRYAQFAAPQGTAPANNITAQSSLSSATAAGGHVTARLPRKRLRDARTTREIREGIRNKVTADGKLQKKHHLQSLLFGLSMGALSLVIVLFGLFNEMVIAPFIQPSRTVSATPIIASNEALIGDGTPRVIIPKINVDIPVDYSVPSMQESVIQEALNDGVVHYPSTVRPGEQGNTAIFGHSSNNIFNPGKYKFAFVLLSKLEEGDIFYLTYNNQVFAYRVFKRQIVNPSDTWVLNPVAGKTATATLITCDPPGTTLHRLVVWGEQISPDPTSAVASETPQQLQSGSEGSELTGAPKSLWSRIVSAINPFD